MNIHAKYFGDISYEPKDTITIKNGLYGFEAYTQYLPISFHDDDDALLSLQCLEDEKLSFILMNPFQLLKDYNPHLSTAELKKLDAASIDDISFYVICVVAEPFSSSTVNLKAPLAVNSRTRSAIQVILEQPEYTFRHSLDSLKK